MLQISSARLVEFKSVILMTNVTVNLLLEMSTKIIKNYSLTSTTIKCLFIIIIFNFISMVLNLNFYNAHLIYFLRIALKAFFMYIEIFYTSDPRKVISQILLY